MDDEVRGSPRPAPAAAVTVLVAAGELLMRSGRWMMFDDHDDVTVVGAAATGAEVLSMVRARQPDVVLVDIRLRAPGAVATTRQLVTTRATSKTKVLVLADRGAERLVYDTLLTGAGGVLFTGHRPDELVAAIRVVAHDTSLVAPETTRRLIEQFAPMRFVGQSAANPLAELSRREREVLTLICEGFDDADVGAMLGLTAAGVRAHTQRVMRKTGVRARVQLAILAYQTGLVAVR